MCVLPACTAVWPWRQTHVKRCTARKDRDRICFAFAFVCVWLEKTRRPPNWAPWLTTPYMERYRKSGISGVYLWIPHICLDQPVIGQCTLIHILGVFDKFQNCKDLITCHLWSYWCWKCFYACLLHAISIMSTWPWCDGQYPVWSFKKPETWFLYQNTLNERLYNIVYFFLGYDNSIVEAILKRWRLLWQ